MDWGENKEPSYNASDWLIFLGALVVLLALLYFDNRFFWVALPFTCTFLVKALKMM